MKTLFRKLGSNVEPVYTSTESPGAWRAISVCHWGRIAAGVAMTVARLCVVAGKPGYLRLIPRVWGQLWRNLDHPDLSTLRAECRKLLPEPTLDVLTRIASQCPISPSR